MINSNDNVFLSYVNESINSIKPFAFMSNVWDIEREHTQNKNKLCAWVTYWSLKNKTKTYRIHRKLPDLKDKRNILCNLFGSMKVTKV